MATKKVKETVETVKEGTKKAAKKVASKAEPAVEAAKSAAKAATGAAKAATDAAKTAGKKVATALSTEIFVELNGEKFDCSNVVDRCKEDFKAKHKGERIRSCRIYIKPEDSMVYYVINELADKISL